MFLLILIQNKKALSGKNAPEKALNKGIRGKLLTLEAFFVIWKSGPDLTVRASTYPFCESENDSQKLSVCAFAFSDAYSLYCDIFRKFYAFADFCCIGEVHTSTLQNFF